MFENCLKGNHKLVTIYSDPHSFGETRVVRWCEICGSIIVDIDVDYRTQPGAVMKMKSPEIVKRQRAVSQSANEPRGCHTAYNDDESGENK